MDELIEEVVARLSRLTLVASATVEAVAESLREATPEDVRVYLDVRVPMIDKLEEYAKGKPHIWAFATRMAEASDQVSVMSEFGLDEFSFFGWIRALKREPDEARSGYVTANMMALFIANFGSVEQTPLIQAVQLFQESRWLMGLDAKAALANVENWLELTPEKYQKPGLSDHLAKRFTGVAMESAVQIMDVLADGLAEAKREEDLQFALEAFLGIDDALYNAHRALELHLEHLRTSYIRQTVEIIDAPEITESSDVFKGKGSLTYFFAEVIRGLSRCLHRRGNTHRAVTLRGAFLGIQPDGLDSLDTLWRLMESLGEDELYEHLEGWVSLVKQAGRRDELTETFATAFGAVPLDPGRLGRRPLRPNPRWSNGEGDAAALFMRALVASLSEDAPEECSPLYLRCSGMTDEEVLTRSDWLSQWLDGVSPALADSLVAAVAACYFFTGRLSHMVNLFEVQFDIRAEEYKTTKLRTVLENRYSGRPHDARLNVSMFVFWSLGLFMSNRVIEAYFLIPEFYSGLTGPDEDFEPFLRDMKESNPRFGEFSVYIMARTLLYAGYLGTSRRLIEEHLGIHEEDYLGSRADLAKKLRGGNRDANHLERSIHALTHTLTLDDRPHHAVFLIEAYLGIDADTNQDLEKIRECLRSLSGAMPAEFSVIWAMAHATGNAGARGLRVLEALLELETVEDYASVDIRDRISRFAVAPWLKALGNAESTATFFGDSTFVDVVAALLIASENAGESAKRQALLESVCQDVSWLDRMSEGVLIQTMSVAGDIIAHLVDRDTKKCLDVCSRCVQVLRDGANLEHLSASDRIRLAWATSSFRRRLVMVGNTLTAREADFSRADVLRRRFLCWDSELGQRVLLERFLFATPGAGWDGAEEPLPRWACRGRLVGSWPTTNAASLGCFDLRENDEATTTPRASGGIPVISVDSEELVERLRKGVDESQLAEVLGYEQQLLRVGFTVDGRLVWSLFARDGNQFQALSHGLSESGVNARERIAGAVRRHDEAIRDAWQRLRLAQKWDDIVSDARLPAPLIATGDWPAVAKWGALLVERLDEYRVHFVSERLKARFPGFASLGADTLLAIDAEEWSGFWSQIAGERIDSNGIEERLDGATMAMLEEVAAIWPLNDLVAVLKQEVDLIVQPEDVLYSVPIAFLKHEGEFLFERVRSIRSVLSLSLLDWLGESDRKSMRETADEPDRILSLSWFKNDDLAARQGAERLHRGHRELSRTLRRGRSKSRPQWYSAADTPTGTHACLAKGLKTHGAYRVVSVCGHGRADVSGIELGDGIWNGSTVIAKKGNDLRSQSACDLLGIELLIQVSCSIGRVRQTEMQDVEGFCVELAVNRARSVLAGLWPLHSAHSPEFATRVADHYLRLRGESIREAIERYEAVFQVDSSSSGHSTPTYWIANRLAESCPRARAVAAVRREWLKGFRAGRGFVGLNTAAAFELFGVG